MRMRKVWPLAALVVAGGMALAPASAAAAEQTSCTICHADADLFAEDEILDLERHFAGDIHLESGLSCHDCHGGNPDPGLADDMDAAMDPKYRPNPFRGVPARTGIPRFCGRCHSDPTYMKRFRPDARVDQEREYATSFHGKALARGDEAVATCIDCHGHHGVRTASSPEAPVYPTNVAETCARCHENHELMAPRGIPVDQRKRWERSVHGVALLEKGDLYAPTCNDCHGNHGATPPGLDSIAFVCGQCHGREAKLFRASAKRDGFEQHREFLQDAGEDGCAACHSDPDPAASYTGPRELSDCITCHGNHSVVRPNVTMLGLMPETPCAMCHEDLGDQTAALAEMPEIREHYEQVRDTLLAQAESDGLQGMERFDWLVDQAQELPWHTETVLGEHGEERRVLRDEFRDLFTRFRIGKAHHAFVDPATGEERLEKVRQCTDCHGPESTLADEPVGWHVARRYISSMQELMLLSARAERAILRARRGGVEMREAQLDLSKAVDAQIALEVLVHAFDAGDDSDFAKRQQQGVEHARAAWEAGLHGLDELAYRRRGLYVTLALIVLVLIGLGIKIRTMGN
ncbi:MAG: hypothetical protein Kow0062_16120 [Acidobacteriota bacterium]